MKLGHGETPEALRRRGKIREVKRVGTVKMIKSERKMWREDKNCQLWGWQVWHGMGMRERWRR